MGFNRRNHPAAANGFSPHSLLKQEDEALLRSWYPCPRVLRRDRFSIGVTSVPVPDAPRRWENDWTAAVHHHYWHELTADQPEWAPSNSER